MTDIREDFDSLYDKIIAENPAFIEVLKQRLYETECEFEQYTYARGEIGRN